MPIRKVSGGYKWGKSGKVYPTKAGAQKQAQAAYASGYKGYKNGGPVAGQQGGNRGLGGLMQSALNTASTMLNPGGFGPGNVLMAGANTLTGNKFGLLVNLLERLKKSSGDPLANPLADPVGGGRLTPESIKNMETAGALSRISSGIYNAPGGKSSGKGAGGLMGQLNRARRKEQRAYKQKLKRAAMRYDPEFWVSNYGLSPERASKAAEAYKQKYSPEYFANIMKEKNMGLGSVLRESWDSFADSYGVPYNIDELMANYEETGELLPGSGGDD